MNHDADPQWNQARVNFCASVTEQHMGKILSPQAALRRRLSKALQPTAPLSLSSTIFLPHNSDLAAANRRQTPEALHSRAPLRFHLPVRHSNPTHLLRSFSPVFARGFHSGDFAHVVLSALNALPHSRPGPFQGPLQPFL